MNNRITPERARKIIDLSRDVGADMVLTIEIFRALETIAAMKTEWGVEIIRGGRSIGIDWCHDRQEAENLAADKCFFPQSDAFRLVHRYVTEVITDE